MGRGGGEVELRGGVDKNVAALATSAHMDSPGGSNKNDMGKLIPNLESDLCLWSESVGGSF